MLLVWSVGNFFVYVGIVDNLYEYGIAAINNYLKYSNVVAGLIAYEVMKRLHGVRHCVLRHICRDIKLYTRQCNMRFCGCIHTL